MIEGREIRGLVVVAQFIVEKHPRHLEAKVRVVVNDKFVSDKALGAYRVFENVSFKN